MLKKILIFIMLIQNSKSFGQIQKGPINDLMTYQSLKVNDVKFKYSPVHEIITPEINELIISMIKDWVFIECENYISMNSEKRYCFRPDSLAKIIPESDYKRYKAKYYKLQEQILNQIGVNEKIKSVVIYTNLNESHIIDVKNCDNSECNNFNITKLRVLNDFFYSKIRTKNYIETIGFMDLGQRYLIVHPIIYEGKYVYDVKVEYIK